MLIQCCCPWQSPKTSCYAQKSVSIKTGGRCSLKYFLPKPLAFVHCSMLGLFVDGITLCSLVWGAQEFEYLLNIQTGQGWIFATARCEQDRAEYLLQPGVMRDGHNLAQREVSSTKGICSDNSGAFGKRERSALKAALLKFFVPTDLPILLCQKRLFWNYEGCGCTRRLPWI